MEEANEGLLMITRCSVEAAEHYWRQALSMGTTDFRSPTNSTSLDWSPKILSQVITSTTATPKPNLVQICL